jgi:hypothetical protein
MINDIMKIRDCKKIISTLVIIAMLSLLSLNAVLAAGADPTALLKVAGGKSGAGFDTSGGDTQAASYLGSIVKYILSFLGVIFIILIIYGGFLWMTAAGDSEQIDKAKDIIKSSVIGLVIILSAMIIMKSIFSMFN